MCPLLQPGFIHIQPILDYMHVCQLPTTDKWQALITRTILIGAHLWNKSFPFIKEWCVAQSVFHVLEHLPLTNSLPTPTGQGRL